MPIRKVYFVRHGETDYNASGLLQGSRIGVKADFLSYSIQGIRRAWRPDSWARPLSTLKGVIHS